jgi:hypothetical protein
MKLASRIVIGVAIVTLAGVGGAAAFGGIFLPSTDAHPPCKELPTAAEATEGLAGNPALIRDIEALGDGVSIAVGMPCPGQDRALIEVAYQSSRERESVGDLLGQRDGFGVPVHLVKH